MEKTALERYEIVEVDRADLKNAPYNPRVISASARRKLRAGIERLGMLAPVTWNRRSGNLVAGHQRLKVLDAIEKTKDYRLTVAAVDLGDVQEREANLLLNNPESQGEWLLEELEAVIKTDGLDIEATGFDMADMFRLFGDSPLQGSDTSAAGIAEVGERLRAARDAYAGAVEAHGSATADDFYLVVVFEDFDARTVFLEELGLDDNRFQDGRVIRSFCQKVSSQSDSESNS